MIAFDTPYLLEILMELHGFWVAGLVFRVLKLLLGRAPSSFKASCFAFSVVCARFFHRGRLPEFPWVGIVGHRSGSKRF